MLMAEGDIAVSRSPSAPRKHELAYAKGARRVGLSVRAGVGPGVVVRCGGAQRSKDGVQAIVYQHWASVGRNRPQEVEYGRNRADSSRSRSKSQVRTNRGRPRSKSGRQRPKSVEVGPTAAQLGPTAVESGRSQVEVGPTAVGRIGPTAVKFVHLSEIGPTAVEGGPTAGEVGRIGPRLAEASANPRVATFGRSWLVLDQHWSSSKSAACPVGGGTILTLERCLMPADDWT